MRFYKVCHKDRDTEDNIDIESTYMVLANDQEQAKTLFPEGKEYHMRDWKL